MPTRAQLEKSRARRAMSGDMKTMVEEAKKGQKRASKAKARKGKPASAPDDKYSRAARKSRNRRAAAKAVRGRRPAAKPASGMAKATNMASKIGRSAVGRVAGQVLRRVGGPLALGLTAGSILAPMVMGDKPKLKTEGGVGKGRNYTGRERYASATRRRQARRAAASRAKKATAGTAAPAPTSKPASASPSPAPAKRKASTASAPKAPVRKANKQTSKQTSKKQAPKKRVAAKMQKSPTRPKVKAQTKDKGFNLGNLSIRRDGWTEDEGYGVPIAKYSVRMAGGGMVKKGCKK